MIAQLFNVQELSIAWAEQEWYLCMLLLLLLAVCWCTLLPKMRSIKMIVAGDDGNLKSLMGSATLPAFLLAAHCFKRPYKPTTTQ